MSNAPKSGSRRGRSRPKKAPIGVAPVASSAGADAERDELLRLASEAAHQIKAPLSTVQTILGTLMAGFAGPLQPRQRWLLEKAVERCGHGVKVVRDLMKLRSLSNLDDEALGPVDLAAVFAGLRDAFREVAVEHEIDFEANVEASGADVWALGQPELVREILSVVFDNAFKYTPRGGRVTATLSTAADAEGAARVCVEVTDTGIGIPAEAYERLFHEFYRAPGARRLSAEGTGLGLAFAFRALRRLGGTIDLSPAATGGVRALVYFPSHPECADTTRIGTALAPEAEELAGAALRHVIVVGGVAAGPKAAADIMRLDPRAEVTIVERGRFLGYSGSALPYYVSGVITEQHTLLETPLGAVRDSSFFHALKNVRALELSEAVRIDRAPKTVRVRALDGTERDLPYDQLVLATGSRSSVPDLPGADLSGVYTLHDLRDAEALRVQLRPARVQDVVIVGAGLLGSQITEAIALRGSRVTLVEAAPSILGILDPDMGLLVQRHLERHGVRVLTRAAAVGFAGDGRVREVLLSDGRHLPCEFVLLATGLRPEVSLGEAAGLAVGTTGAFLVDRQLRTSDPDIYAIGDCSEHPHLVSGRPAWFPGAAPAAIQGRVAAFNICGGCEEYPGTLATLIVKLFDAAVGRTGLTTTEAAKAGFDPVTVTVPGLDHAHFVPNAQPLVLRLIADRTTRRVLGAQAFGAGQVDKRLDVMATAISAGLDVDALAHLNLGYAPPYSLAMDLVLAAANVLRNKLDGRFRGVSALELWDALGAPAPPTLIDVRLPSEFGVARLPGSRHIPLGVLRSRIGELPRDRPIVLVCKVGLRSYEASLILQAAGLQNVRVLEGGLETWPFELERLT